MGSRRRTRKPDPWPTRAVRRIKDNAWISGLLLIGAVISAVIVIASPAITLFERLDRQLDWRDKEYVRLNSLAAGFSRAVFAERLGSPLFDRESDDGRFREQTFRRRGHWVQAVSDRQGTVLLYAVTACDPEFKPEFALPGDPSRVFRLNEATFNDVGGMPIADYFIGNTSNTRFMERFSVGNPSLYQMAVWGINDACPNWVAQLDSLREGGAYPPSLGYQGPATASSKWLKRFRRRAVINTYGETAPDFRVEDLKGAFQVGVDRILIRTVLDNG